MFKTEQLWVSEDWEALLREADLLDIEAVQNREFDWFEQPNKRRGGWSGVSRIILNPNAPTSEQVAVFLKIQQNHTFRDPKKLFKKYLTFEREFNVLKEVGKITESIPEVVLFAKWSKGSDIGAILITKALDDWLPLGEWIRGANGHTAPNEATLLKALEAIADSSREINDAGWVHLCYSAKHLFVQQQADGSFKSCVIDLEKSRKHLRSTYRTMKDCSHFMRHTPNLTDQQKRHYLESYFQTKTFSAEQKKQIQKMRGAPSI